MAEILLEQRVISGEGLLRYPAVETPIRYVSLLIDVIRQPISSDISFRYNPPRQRYATLVFLRGGYVIEEIPMDYARRRIDWVLDAPGQTLLAVKCAHKANLAFYASLAGSVSPAPVVPSNTISEFPNLNLIWDEVRIVCFKDTGLQVRLFGEPYNECGDPYNEIAPPPPPAPLAPTAPGSPLDNISPPYESDDVTSPYPGDTVPPPTPEGTACAPYTLSWQWTRASDGAVFSRSWTIRGGYFVDSLDWNVTGLTSINWVMITQGSAGLPSGLPACRPAPALATLFSDTNGIPSNIFNIVVTPV